MALVSQNKLRKCWEPYIYLKNASTGFNHFIKLLEQLKIYAISILETCQVVSFFTHYFSWIFLSNSVTLYQLRGHLDPASNQYRFSAFWLRSKCSICSYQLNIWYVDHVSTSILIWFFQGEWLSEACFGSFTSWPGIAVPPGSAHFPIIQPIKAIQTKGKQNSWSKRKILNNCLLSGSSLQRTSALGRHQGASQGRQGECWTVRSFFK